MERQSRVSISQYGFLSFKKAYQFVNANRLPWLYLSLVGLSIPVLLFELIYGYYGVVAADRIMSFVRESRGRSVAALMSDLASGIEWQLWLAFGVTLLSLSVVIAALLSICGMAGNRVEARRWFISLLAEVLLAWRKGVWIFLTVLIFLFFLRGMLLLFFTLLALSMMTPTILSLNRDMGIWSVLKQAFTLSYSTPTQFSRWATLFQLLSYVAILILSLILTNLAGESVLYLDDYFPFSRHLFIEPVLFNVITVPYLASLVIKIFFSSLLISFFMVFLTHYYLQFKANNGFAAEA